MADHVHPADAVALSERGFHPLDQATSVLATEHQPIQDHMEIRPVRPGEQGAGVKVYELIPALQSHEAAGEQRLDQDAVVPWARVLNREQDHRARLGKAGQQIVRHAPRMVAARLFPAVGADGPAQLGEEQPEEVRNLGRCADGGSSRANRVLLLDGDGRADVDQPIDIGPVQPFEKHPGVGAQRFHVAPLAFGKQGVEGQRGLAGARHAGDRGHRIVRNTEGDVLEVVLPRPLDQEVASGPLTRVGQDVRGFKHSGIVTRGGASEQPERGERLTVTS